MVARHGPRHRVEVQRWGHGFGHWFLDLTDVANHGARARQMADAVLAFRERCPDRPAFLVGKSGGCGVVARALELLPEDSEEHTSELQSLAYLVCRLLLEKK